MYPFQYERAKNAKNAVSSVAKNSGATFIAGGTSHIDLMKEEAHRPSLLVDISGLPLKTIAAFGGGLRIGANVSNAAAATFPEIQIRYTVLSEAILAGASTQIRNMASMAGNPLQRTRCPYFRDTTQACNKRAPGSGCAALTGINRVHAIFGASPACIATHPSDMAVALSALDAMVQTTGPRGNRSIPFVDFHRLPGNTPQFDTVLEQGELITSIDLPAFSGRSHYLKVRDRASYAYALVSCAVTMEMDGDTMRRVRIALGGVAHKPWRAREAEAMLAGKKPSPELFREAATMTFASAKPLEHNAYKIPLGQNTMTRALMETSGLLPLQGAAGTAFASSAGGIAGAMTGV
ncbi:xanthine dehydrogenase YagS FAD-binding subunit [Abditibacterium utsteinense]|uniref:Xanthine dehydrogenase YagS FAD-binding subunit n=1 Tax=Abditibacterium utsteinense TaxID=1960156 RepID=A0A2S8SQ53_9BACT|nr:xanthine dehydrogenase family protein subunit M [Abditibacterium utsteinense]PQV62925.1 xanthine dehydrogenase YagS FAD-binding subunit [Abditibacterium utsteinense]